MAIWPFHDPNDGELKVVGLMSGSGTNLLKILEHQYKLAQERGASPYRIVALFSDNAESQALNIGREHDLPVIVRDIGAYYAKRSRPRSDMQLREAYDVETIKALAFFEAKVAAYGGYMSIASEKLTSAFVGINVHPADLGIRENGQRKFTGDHAVRDAILAGETTLASSTHIIEPEVDGGRLLAISHPIPIELPEGFDSTNREMLDNVSDANQERLKTKGDWIVFPMTLEYLADGRLGYDENGTIHFDGKPIPEGLRL